MYTPTANARRPRPPGSYSKHATSSKPSERISRKTRLTDTYDAPRPERQAAHGSPSTDLANISLTLDMDESPRQKPPTGSQPNMSSIFAGTPTLPSTELLAAEPSPPPPYGNGRIPLSSDEAMVEHTCAPTPLRQDSGTSSRPSVDGWDAAVESQRKRRAAEAAQAIGMESAFSNTTSGTDTREASPELEEGVSMSEATLRAKYAQIQKQLHRREKELRLAAEVADRALQSNERLVAQLPSDLKARLPDLLNLFEPARSPSNRRSSSSARSASSNGAASSTRSRAGSSNVYLTADSNSDIRGIQRHAASFSEGDDSSSQDEDAQISSGSHASSGRFRTVRSSDVHLPFPLHHARPGRARQPLPTMLRVGPSESHARISALQQELAEEKIQALEAALSEAMEGEESQRKAAARLRREVEKLQRDYERAESDMEAHQAGGALVTELGGYHRSNRLLRRQHDHSTLRNTRSSSSGPRQEPIEGQKASFRWGSTTFPEFLSSQASTRPDAVHGEDEDHEPDLGEVTDKMKKTTRPGESCSSISSRSYPGSVNGSRFSTLPSRSGGATTPIRLSGTLAMSSSSSRSQSGRSTRSASGLRGHQTLSAIHRDNRRPRKQVSRSSFLDPSSQSEADTSHSEFRPRTPTVTVQAPEETRQFSSVDSQQAGNSRRIRKSPWPTPYRSSAPGISAPRSMRAGKAFSSASSRSPSLSPAYATISSRMAAMSAFVAAALEESPSKNIGALPMGRSLGSELGSDYGDRPESSLRLVEDSVLRPTPSRSARSTRSYGSYRSDDDGRSVYSEGYFEPPAPLPASVSAALSSLAEALAPYTSPAPPEGLPKQRQGLFHRYTDPALDPDARNLFEEAFTARKIRWADAQTSSLEASADGPAQDSGIETESVFASSGKTSSIIKLAMAEAQVLVQASPKYPMAMSKNARSRLYEQLQSPSKPQGRPPYMRHGSSDGSIALAHRRRSSNQANFASQSVTAEARDVVKGRTATKVDEREPDSLHVMEEEDDEWVDDKDSPEPENDGPLTIPGRVVHDIICLIAIFIDFVECFVFVVYRILLDLRYKRKSFTGMSRRANMKRYYL